MMMYCARSNQSKYPFELPELPFAKADFGVYLSPETLDYHYNRHHKTYVNKLNELIASDLSFADHDLETVIAKSYRTNPGIFNNAAQVWNHSFFWHSIDPSGGGAPPKALLEQIVADFGSYIVFSEQFREAALSQFGSGWAWLVYADGRLRILKTSNADTPITSGAYPLLTCDVWEHAYYIDYRNRRIDYITAFLNHMVHWDFANENLHRVRR